MHELVLSLWCEHRLTVFMVTHDIQEGFKLGTRLLVFDSPNYRATTTTVTLQHLVLANAEAGSRLVSRLFVRLAPSTGSGFAGLVGSSNNPISGVTIATVRWSVSMLSCSMGTACEPASHAARSSASPWKSV